MKENYKSILLLSLLFIVLMHPVSYYITTGGGTIDIKNRVKIENEYTAKGSLHLAYVEELEGNVATYLLSFLMPKWERIDSSLYQVNEEESIDSINFRNHLELQESISNAIEIAYKKAGKVFEVSNNHIYIVYVSKMSKSKLKVGDELLTADGEKITSLDELKTLISKKETKEQVIFKIIRNKKEKEIKAEIYEEEGQKLVGISIAEEKEYKTDPKIELSFKKSESGPSGGLMLTLDIYNKLTRQDITKGYKIVGTGTMEKDGSVGEIGGVKYKLRGAVKNKADIFLVPEDDNYKEAIKEKRKENYNIKIIGVKNIDEALASLKNLKEKRDAK